MNNTFSDDLPMPQDGDMPPLPRVGEVGPQVCAMVQLYLGVMDDLTAEQVEIIQEHVRGCADCAGVQRVMQRATQVFGGLPGSAPSSRVDEAVMAAIAARGRGRILATRRGGSGEDEGKGPLGRPWEEEARQPGTRATRSSPPRVIPTPAPTGRGGVRLRWGAVAAVAMAAVVVLSFLTTTHLMPGFGSTPQAFTLPANLSWNGYVIYHSETRIDAHGVRYRVNTYYDAGSGREHVETVMPGSMDIVAVGDGHSILGMDMMHQVAQLDANEWSTDESMFNLAEIRSDMKTSRAVFMDKDVFRGEAVYRIRCSNGLVLLLNMQYKPVNVLRGAVGPGTGEPVYTSLALMPSSHVSSEMWDMRVPRGFKMGVLPGKP
jgi:hypothetical protein